MIPLFKPYMPELPELDSILHSDALSYGDYTKMFEDSLKEYFDTTFLMAINDFHLAISVALRAIGVKPGDSVIASPMACLVSMQPLLTYGLKIIWADVDPQTGTLDPDSVKKNITKDTRLIIHNHFCGYPGHINAINDIGRQYGIHVMDDGIESFGSEYHGMKIGNCGTDVTVFALSPVRFCNCIEGGIIIFNNEESYNQGLLIRDCGIDRSRFRDELGEINPNCDISLVGYSATMSNVNGYIGFKQMESIATILNKHRQQAYRWDLFFKEQTKCSTIRRDHCKPNYWVYGTLSNDKVETIKMFREMGYYASGVHMRNDVYSVFGPKYKSLPGVDAFNRRFVALPCGWWME